jgi:hypothetical protein
MNAMRNDLINPYRSYIMTQNKERRLRMLTRENLKEYINYDPGTGKMVWIKKGRGLTLGKEVGSITCGDNGYYYRRMKFEGRMVAAHRVIWLYMTGEYPEMLVEHVDKDTLNNKWCNLRLTSMSKRCSKSVIPKNNKTEIAGVSFNKKGKAWRASISVGKKAIYLGIYKDFFEACCARKSAEARYHNQRKELPMITYENLREHVHYDPITGDLTWIKRPASRSITKIGSVAGYVKRTKNRKSSYLQIRINGVFTYVHRVIWFYMTGELPTQVYHIDGNGLNNRWENLKSGHSNAGFRGNNLYKSNTSGVAGVNYMEKDKLWVARIGVGKSRKYLGCFKDFEEACRVRREAEAKYGYHENHGRIDSND